MSKALALFFSSSKAQPLCCQIDESTWVVVVFLFSCCFGGSFCFSFVSEGHILSNCSNLKLSNAFMGRSAKFPFKIFYSLVYFFVLHWDF